MNDVIQFVTGKPQKNPLKTFANREFGKVNGFKVNVIITKKTKYLEISLTIHN